MFRLAMKMTLRDWRAGELRLLLMALVLSVAAISAVGFFAERLRAGMLRDSAQLLAADMTVASDDPLPPALREEARRLGLRTAATVAMAGMASSGANDALAALASLASVKAVDDAYPLRGAVLLQGSGAIARGMAATNTDRHDGAARDATANGTAGDGAAGGQAWRSAAAQDAGSVAAQGAPARGTVWIDAALAARLDTGVGGMLRIGAADFIVAALIAVEPDRRPSPVSIAPRAMMAAADLAGTQVMQPGVRARHTLLVAGEAQALAAFQRYVTQAKLPGVSTKTAQEAGNDLADILDKLRSFMSLAGVIAAMLAAVAIAMAARRYGERHLDACAMLRCLGLRARQVLALHAIEFTVLGLAGGALGVALGYASHVLLLHWLGGMLPAGLPPPSVAAGAVPAAQGIAMGLALLAGFALPPLLQLQHVPHAHLSRREASAPRGAAIAAFMLGGAVLAGLMLWIAGDVMLGAGAALGFALAGGVFACVAWLALAGLPWLVRMPAQPISRRLRAGAAWPAWRLAQASLRRQRSAAVAQVVSLAAGLTALLLLTVVRGDLQTAWRAAQPAGAANHFIFNIQPDQQQAVAARLRGLGNPVLHSSIRARLLEVNGKPHHAKGEEGAEVDMSASAGLPAASTLVQGRWFTRNDSAPQASLGEDFARRHGIHPGDRLAFDVGGLPLQTTVTSLRKIDWRRRTPSFDVVLNPAAAQDLPATYVSAFRAEDGDRTVAALARDYPNVSVIDVGYLVRQMQRALEQAAAAVEFLFLFTLAMGLLVLYAALAGSQDARMRQAALLRALGATRRLLARAQWLELALTGMLAGMLAALGASIGGWALAHYVFDLTWGWPPTVWPAGAMAGVACALAGGWPGLRHVLHQPPLHMLRQA